MREHSRSAAFEQALRCGDIFFFDDDDRSAPRGAGEHLPLPAASCKLRDKERRVLAVLDG